jgi:hypothetical protein
MLKEQGMGFQGVLVILFIGKRDGMILTRYVISEDFLTTCATVYSIGLR